MIKELRKIPLTEEQRKRLQQVILARVQEQADKQSLPVGRRLGPALSGLEWIVSGKRFDEQGTGGVSGESRRLLGWSTGQHWLLGAETREARG